MMSRLSIALVAALAVAGCATQQRTAEVARFHLGQPIPSDTIAIVPLYGNEAFNLEYRTYADALLRELAAAGFRPVSYGDKPAYEAIMKVEQTTRPDPRPRPRSSFSFGVGLGGGGYRSGGGVSVGGAVPIGRPPRESLVRVNFLSLQIKRRSDNSIVWEGRATEALADRDGKAALPDAVPGLAHALLAGFPGPAGRTVIVPVN